MTAHCPHSWWSFYFNGGGIIVSEQMITITINGTDYSTKQGTTILEVINENNIPHPQVCYTPELGAIQTCDTCIVEADGKLVRACATPAKDGMNIELSSERAKAAQKEAMDRILENHLLYCTVCDNNNGNCKLHNTAEMIREADGTCVNRGMGVTTNTGGSDT